MELNAEINKVFGEEMAKLFAAKITEDEMMEAARKAWVNINSFSGPSWDRKDSALDKMVKSAILTNLQEEVNKITETEVFKEQMHNRAEQIVNEIVEETHKKMVEEVSNRLAVASTGYGGYGIRTMVEQIIHETLDKRY